MLKNSYLCILILILIICSNTVYSQWSTPVEITSGSAPDMDIDPRTGNVLMVAAAKSEEVVYTLFDSNGAIISQEIVTGTDGEKGNGHFGPSVAVDTLGYPHIAFKIYDRQDKYDLYYIYKDESGWSERIQIAEGVIRGYSFRIDVDDKNRVHLAHGSTTGEDVWGPITYYRFEDGVLTDTQTGITKYRTDDRIEIDARGNDDLQLIIGCPDPNGGQITYWRSTNGGEDLNRVEDIHHDDCHDRNGSPDVFVDQTGTVHFCYGAKKDASLDDKPSVRYAQYENGIKVMDIPVTPANFLQEWHHSLGLASIAAANDGQNIMICFQITDGGEIYTTQSNNAGETWSAPAQLTGNGFNGYEGRNKQLVRANQDRFYVVYPAGDEKLYLQWIALKDGQPPVAHAGGPYSGREGSPVLFDASLSTDNSGIEEYAWDWNADGIFDESTTLSTIEHIFTDDYDGIVLLKVIDSAGLFDIDTAAVNIVNTNPLVDIGGDFSGNEGAALTFSAVVTDSGAADTHTVTWHFGDGDSTNGATVTHQYADNGTYAVTCRVDDQDGGSGSAQSNGTIENAAPVPDAGGPYQGASNDTIRFTGSATDAGTADTSSLTFQWDLDNDGLFDASGSTARWHYLIAGEHTIRLQATDKDGGAATNSATLTISNSPPVVQTIPNQEIGENETFTDIQLDEFVSDSENPPDQITWLAEGMTDLTVTITERVASISPIDPNWDGSEVVRFIARDPSNTADTTQVTFTVNKENDSPVALTIEDQTIRENENFQVISLNNYVTDPDDSPEEMHWTAFGNQSLIVNIEQSSALSNTIKPSLPAAKTMNWIATIAVADSEWHGAETITFVVTDPGQLSDSTEVKFTVTPINDAPQIDEIPAQIISQSQQFPALQLDDYVFDPDNADSSLTWSYSGNVELQVSLTNRVAQITAPTPTWEGTEKITFEVSDPGALSAQKEVTFRRSIDNHPPVLAQMPDISFAEDEGTSISRKSLEALTTDPDNAPGDFSFSLLASANILWEILHEDSSLQINAQANWNGSESATLVVDDGFGGKDSSTFSITVSPVADPPNVFNLISPVGQTFTNSQSTILFNWESATDPDGDSVQYFWLLSQSADFADTLAFIITADTAYNYQAAPTPLGAGDYSWKVIAFSIQDNLTRENAAAGHFTINADAVDDLVKQSIPDQFQLMQNHPNPFNPETRITYHLPEAATVQLEIFNMMGELVQIIDRGEKSAGAHSVTWHGLNEAGQPVSSGIYTYRLRAGAQTFIKKMLLMR